MDSGRQTHDFHSKKLSSRARSRRMFHRKLSSRMYCPRCGEREVVANIRYCSGCGLALGTVRLALSVVREALEDHERVAAKEELPDSDTVTLLVPTPLDEVERRVILLTLRKTGGNKTRAAQLLKINKKTLYNKLRTYGLNRSGSLGSVVISKLRRIPEASQAVNI